MSSQERMTRAEVSAQNLRAERDMLKNIEHRLLQDKEAKAREQASHQLMMANLQAIQVRTKNKGHETFNAVLFLYAIIHWFNIVTEINVLCISLEQGKGILLWLVICIQLFIWRLFLCL